MPQPELADVLQQWANLGFEWVGFSVVSGILAKAIMPGRDPGGAVATFGIGLGGAFIGCGILAYFLPDFRVSPLSPMGFLVATAGAFVLLFFYRLLAGYVIREDGQGYVPRPMFTRRRYNRRRETYYDDRL